MSGDQIEKRLKHLSFWRGGYFGTNELIILKTSNGRLDIDHYSFSHENLRETIPHFHGNWTKGRSNRWLTRIEEIHFELWKDKYWADVCDGEQWRLRFQFEDENERIVSGSNAYPKTWPQFVELMTAIARKLSRVEDAEIKAIIGLL